MAVVALFKGKGFTKTMYEALRPVVNWETDLAPGGMLHVCCFDSDGNVRVTDVWESEEKMQAFVGTRLIPGLQKLGIPMPEVELFPAHNVNVYPAATRHMLK